MGDLLHISIQETLTGIRQRAGRSIEGLAAYLQVPVERVQLFEQHINGDQWLLDIYGLLARQEQSHE